MKYELARGSFGGDNWTINYRSLDTLDVFNLNLANMPGRNLWNPAVAGSVRDRRVPNFDTVVPGIKPMYQDSFNAGLEYQVNPATVLGATYIHNNVSRTIEDFGALVMATRSTTSATPVKAGAPSRRRAAPRSRSRRRFRSASTTASS